MTSLLNAPLAGVQLPRVSSGPPVVDSLGTEVAEFCESIGLVLDPWQRLCVNVIHGVRPDGKWAAFESGLLVARQNGKGAVLEATELAALFMFGSRLIMHSAHEFKTAAEAFLRVKSLVDGSDELSKRVARMRTSHGDEGIELRDGARLRFVARSRSSGRGFSGDDMILDEAQELPLSAMGAMLPTLSARPNPRVVYAGTVPAPENDSEHWASLRDRGRTGTDTSLAWLEWSPPEPEDDYDLDDETVWAETNPALGIRITAETVARERNSLDAPQFARERLSIWAQLDHEAVIDPRLWAELADPRSAPTDPVAFAVDVSPARRHASFAVAGYRADGLLHVETPEARAGVGWLVDYLAERVQRNHPCAVVLDAAGPAGSLVPDLERAGVEVTTTGANEMKAACGAFYDAAVEKRLRHLNGTALNTALGAARKRPLGDAWAWHRKDTTADITPLVAATLAVYGVLTADRPVDNRMFAFR